MPHLWSLAGIGRSVRLHLITAHLTVVRVVVALLFVVVCRQNDLCWLQFMFLKHKVKVAFSVLGFLFLFDDSNINFNKVSILIDSLFFLQLLLQLLHGHLVFLDEFYTL